MAVIADDIKEMMRMMLENNQRLSDAILKIASENQQAAVAAEARNAALVKDMRQGPKRAWEDIERYKNVKHFAGKREDWEEWYNKVKGQIKSGCADAFEVVSMVENKMAEKDLEADDYASSIALDVAANIEQIEQISARLHNLLTNITTGEANAVVRRSRAENGLLAWKRLCADLNPRTLASGVKAINQAMNPIKITDPKKADVMIDLWEDKVSKLMIEYNEQLSNKVKLAALYGMLPKDFQEKVLDKCSVNWDQVKEEEAGKILNTLKEDIKNIAKSRKDACAPTPMECDQITGKGMDIPERCEDFQGAQHEDWWHDQQGCEGMDINAVGKGQYKGKGKGKCHNCGQEGHYKYNCPHKGYMKGYDKGGGKGQSRGSWEKGGGGKGYGQPRACFTCGSLDHLARFCPSNKQVNEISSGPIGEPEILFIGATEVVKAQKTKDIEMKMEDVDVCVLDDVDWDGDGVKCSLRDERQVMSVDGKGTWISMGQGEITVDSAADESCWPEDMGGAFQIRASKRNIRLRAANGTDMKHLGEKDVTFKDSDSGTVMGMTFQVTEVKKALAAVWRLAEKGNIVQFGPEEHHNYILNLATKKKIKMQRKGGSYVLKVEFVKWVPEGGSPVFGGPAMQRQ